MSGGVKLEGVAGRVTGQKRRRTLIKRRDLKQPYPHEKGRIIKDAEGGRKKREEEGGKKM